MLGSLYKKYDVYMSKDDISFWQIVMQGVKWSNLRDTSIADWRISHPRLLMPRQLSVSILTWRKATPPRHQVYDSLHRSITLISIGVAKFVTLSLVVCSSPGWGNRSWRHHADNWRANISNFSLINTVFVLLSAPETGNPMCVVSILLQLI